MSELIPDGWKYEPLSLNTILITKGATPTTYGFNYIESLTEGGARFIRGNNATAHGEFKGDSVKYICKDANDQLKRSKLATGDLIISIVGSVGTSFQVEENIIPANINQNVALVRPSKTLNSNYLKQVVVSDIIQNTIANELTVQAQPSLSLKQIGDFSIPLPPLPEQQKIAAILSSVDEVIEKTQAQINKLKDLKTGMMQELLSPREGQAANIHITQGESKNSLHHTEFKDSPLGRIPVGWEVVKFESATVKIQDGTHFSPQSKDGECLYLTSKNIQNGKLDLRKISYISQKEHDGIYKRCNVQFGDVLLTKDGANTGNCAMNTLTQPFSLLSSVAFLRCDTSQCLNEFMYQYILSSKFQSIIQDSMTGNAITRLTLTIIKNMNLTLPPINEQKKIVEALSSVDRYIDERIKKMEAFKNTKKSLMQDLLTGKVRVKVDAA